MALVVLVELLVLQLGVVERFLREAVVALAELVVGGVAGSFVATPAAAPAATAAPAAAPPPPPPLPPP